MKTEAGMRLESARHRMVWAGCVAGLVHMVALCPLAMAQTGINLSWDDCGSFGSASKSIACDTNAGSSTLVSSLVAPPGLVCVGAIEAVLDLQVAGETLPDWWVFKNAGACRQNELQLSFNFASGPSSCAVYDNTVGIQGFGYESGFGAPNRARITLVGTYPSLVCVPMVEGVETYAFKLILSHDKSVGGGACAGCAEGACVVLNAITVVDYGGGVVSLTAPLARNHVTWQGGIPDCPAATPVRNRTWGAVKSLYR